MLPLSHQTLLPTYSEMNVTELMCTVIKTISAFHMEGFQSAFPFCPLDFGSGAAWQPLAQHILRVSSGVKCAGGWALKSAFIIEYRIVTAVMQQSSQVGDFKERDDETSHLLHIYYHMIYQKIYPRRLS